MMHRHIYHLLLEHDCVVVPGLGGFLCQYKSASIDFQKGVISPPARTIGFNKALQQNDGLLVQEVVIQEMLLHREAEEKVKLYVQETIDKLHRHGSVQIPSIGRLYMDQFQSIQFSPSQDPLPLEDSFGLSTVTAQPILRRDPAIRPEIRQTEAEPLHEPAKIEFQNQQRSWPYWIAASFAGILIAGTIWINSMDTDIKAGLKAGFNPLSLLEEVQPQIPVSVEWDNDESVSLYDVDNQWLDADNSQELVEVDSDISTPGVLNQTQDFTIVVGAYKGPITASEYRDLLIGKGYRAEMLGVPGQGLLKVVVYVNAEDELTALRTIRRDVEPEAWLLQ
jgi:hypothetical protein